MSKMLAPKVLTLGELAVGDIASVVFSVTEEDMITFAELSGDRSRIHHDSKFARKNGFKAPVVYGALSVAHLSFLVGMHLPGDLGCATSWKIDFHEALYVSEEATISAKIVHISKALRVLSLEFEIKSESRLIAQGTAEAKLLIP
jgi:acyl dehydratase